MELREFKEYMEERLDKEKFENKLRISIEEKNREIEEEKHRVKDKNIPTVIKQNWDHMIKFQYDLIRKTLLKENKENDYEEWEKFISENELVEQTNSSFSEY
ncbi:hypothetical protein [Paraclostridium sordellii]|uniref:hypothetical protein n=1 Tax=Paraclostridium sordellii TaxID=1505 RepID=UPI000386D776|nr:hypothetical protein [Paeniclostridium sordellii]AUO31614.1 hypothetical protein [Paeniclostridium sordellii]AUO31708.1 hypothetical protein [Paeniclostridium sordellii]EPZ61084.1 hypothetical protein H476_0280 [[Clostridium] sordellii VPI 9048] [Paeniclostridium sordellii VPI 9048]CEK40057.1 hypothetical protein JGS6382_PCS1300161 (plasmid) [[Clostridium] sordellii] [Paeniclostridium sordellii]